MLSKWMKSLFLSALLIVGGYFFGTLCLRVGGAYALLLSPSRKLLTLSAWLLAAWGLIAVAAGIVAALVRPLWAAFLAFIASGLALVYGWEVSWRSGALALLYVLAGVAYVVSTDSELKQRISFSVRPVVEGQTMLLMVLLVVALVSFYFGCAEQIKREGFSIPEDYISKFAEEISKQVAAQAPAAQRQAVQAEASQQFRRMADDLLKQRVEPFERFIPLAITVSLFMSLWSITRFLSWLPALILDVIFRLLTTLGIAKVTTETLQVKRLVLS
jgi:hypothetical protein